MAKIFGEGSGSAEEPIGDIPESGSGFHRHDRPARSASETDPVSKDYNDLTSAGVEHAREVAKEEILETIAKAPLRALMFIGGKSDQPRSGQTGEVWGEALSEVVEGREDLVVLTKKQIDEMRGESKEKGGKVINSIQEIIRANPDKKVVVDYPLFIKQFGYGFEDRWTEKDKKTDKIKKTEYFSEILKKYNNDHAACIADWLKNDGKLALDDGRVLQGPRPEDVAKEYIEGLSRLYQFTKDMVPDRPVLVQGIGHQWDLDAVVTFLATGSVTYENWVRAMGLPEAEPKEQVIGEGESVGNVMINPTTGESTVNYRGRQIYFHPSRAPLNGTLKGKYPNQHF
jgi:hypothetical protein